MWNLPPPPGFQGLREDLPLRVYVRNMPHWRQPGATYFVTFRLHDALPEQRLRELRSLKEAWKQSCPPPRSREQLEQLARMVFQRVEHWLAQGTGSCLLRQPDFTKRVARALLYFEGERYELGASVVMPNHVHAIVPPLLPAENDLEDIIGSWKSFTARSMNAELDSSGMLWQEECYDRIIRDGQHLWNSLQYVGVNPRKANLANRDCYLWINPKWRRLGWKFAFDT